MASKNEKETKETLESLSKAKRYSNSMRGKFLISQALTIAIKHLKKLENRKDMFPKYGEHAEPANRENMEYLKKELYPLYDVIPRSRKVLREWGIVKDTMEEDEKLVFEEQFDGEPTTADEYNKEHIDEMNEAIKETPEYKLGKKVFGGDTGTDADYYNENNEEYIK